MAINYATFDDMLAQQGIFQTDDGYWKDNGEGGYSKVSPGQIDEMRAGLESFQREQLQSQGIIPLGGAPDASRSDLFAQSTASGTTSGMLPFDQYPTLASAMEAYYPGGQAVQGPDGQWYWQSEAVKTGPAMALPTYEAAPDMLGNIVKSALIGLAGYGLGGAAGLWDVGGAAGAAEAGGAAELLPAGVQASGAVTAPYLPALAGVPTSAALPALGAAGAAAGVLGDSAIADIVAAEGGYSALPSAGMAGTAATAAGAAGATTAAQSLLSKIASGAASDSDWMQLAGILGKTGLGIYGANQQQDAYEDFQNQYLDIAKVGLDEYDRYRAPGFDVSTIPGLKSATDLASQSVLSNLSAKVGNPYGNPGALAEAEKYVTNSTVLPQYNTVVNQALQRGGMGLQPSATGGAAAAGQVTPMFNAAGYGIQQATTPESPYKGLLEQMMFKQLGGTGLV